MVYTSCLQVGAQEYLVFINKEILLDLRLIQISLLVDKYVIHWYTITSQNP